MKNIKTGGKMSKNQPNQVKSFEELLMQATVSEEHRKLVRNILYELIEVAREIKMGDKLENLDLEGARIGLHYYFADWEQKLAVERWNQIVTQFS